MHDLKRVIIIYEQVIGNVYIFKFDNKEYHIHFKRENMKHLLGIHKLNDIKGIATLHSKKITSTNNRVTDTICNSNKIYLISDRITYFNKIFKF